MLIKLALKTKHSRILFLGIFLLQGILFFYPTCKANDHKNYFEPAQNYNFTKLRLSDLITKSLPATAKTDSIKLLLGPIEELESILFCEKSDPNSFFLSAMEIYKNTQTRFLAIEQRPYSISESKDQYKEHLCQFIKKIMELNCCPKKIKLSLKNSLKACSEVYKPCFRDMVVKTSRWLAPIWALCIGTFSIALMVLATRLGSRMYQSTIAVEKACENISEFSSQAASVVKKVDKSIPEADIKTKNKSGFSFKKALEVIKVLFKN